MTAYKVSIRGYQLNISMHTSQTFQRSFKILFDIFRSSIIGAGGIVSYSDFGGKENFVPLARLLEPVSIVVMVRLLIYHRAGRYGTPFA